MHFRVGRTQNVAELKMLYIFSCVYDSLLRTYGGKYGTTTPGADLEKNLGNEITRTHIFDVQKIRLIKIRSKQFILNGLGKDKL